MTSSRNLFGVTFYTTITVAVFVFFSLLYFSPLSTEKVLSNIMEFARSSSSKEDKLVILGIAGAFLYNIIPDFLSLCETRFVLTYLHRVSTSKRIIGYMLIDLLLSTGIFVTWFVAVFGSTLAFESATEKWPPIVSSSILLGAMFGVISNYLSSGWVWLYGAAGAISRWLDSMLRGKITKTSGRFLDIEARPFEFIALLTSVLLAVGGTIIYSVGAILRVIA